MIDAGKNTRTDEFAPGKMFALEYPDLEFPSMREISRSQFVAVREAGEIEEGLHWEEVEDAVVETCDDALKVLWHWNNEDLWCDNDSLYLNELRRGQTVQNGDMLTTSSEGWNSEDISILRDICTLGGLTARLL